MEPLIPILLLIGFIVAWHLILNRSAGGRMFSPLWMAFGATFSAVLLISTGVIGYSLQSRARFLTGTAWSDSVIWWQVELGLVLLLLAAYSWRRAWVTQLRQLR